MQDPAPPLYAVLATADGVVIRFSRVPFSTGSDELAPPARYELDRHVRLLRGVVGSRLLLEGGEGPPGGLGARRTIAVRRYLRSLGVDRSRLAKAA